MNKMKFFAIGTLSLITSWNTAYGTIPDESGFSGFISFGGSGVDLKSNTVAGDSMETFSKKRISSLTSRPGSESTGTGFINGEVKYTWAESRTQVFLGNTLEDWIRYDITTDIGVRQEVNDIGELSASFLFSAFPTRVWEDPYLVNANRSDTDRKSTGGSIGWNNIMGSHAQVKLSARKIDIDKELSGEQASLGLNPSQKHMLSRKGDSRAAQLLYRYHLNDQQTLIPALIATRYDLDGKAMASDEYLFQLSYLWGFERWQTVTNLLVGRNKYDKANPIRDFRGKTRKDDIYGASLALFYSEPFNLKDWNVMATLAGFKSNSNINFYDTDISALSLGLLYRF